MAKFLYLRRIWIRFGCLVFSLIWQRYGIFRRKTVDVRIPLLTVPRVFRISQLIFQNYEKMRYDSRFRLGNEMSGKINCKDVMAVFEEFSGTDRAYLGHHISRFINT